MTNLPYVFDLPRYVLAYELKDDPGTEHAQ